MVVAVDNTIHCMCVWLLLYVRCVVDTVAALCLLLYDDGGGGFLVVGDDFDVLVVRGDCGRCLASTNDRAGDGDDCGDTGEGDDDDDDDELSDVETAPRAAAAEVGADKTLGALRLWHRNNNGAAVVVGGGVVRTARRRIIVDARITGGRADVDGDVLRGAVRAVIRNAVER